MTVLDEIRARDAAKSEGRSGVTMTQAEADRRTLLRVLDDLTGRATTPTTVVVDEVAADAAAAYLYLRPFLGLSDLLPDGTPQDAPVRIGALRAILAERHALTARAEAAEDAFERLHARVNRDFNFDASESAAPDDEYWARLMDDLVTFATEQALALEARTQGARKTGQTDPQHAPHLVTVTRLDPGFDLDDRRLAVPPRLAPEAARR